MIVPSPQNRGIRSESLAFDFFVVGYEQNHRVNDDNDKDDCELGYIGLHDIWIPYPDDNIYFFLISRTLKSLSSSVTEFVDILRKQSKSIGVTSKNLDSRVNIRNIILYNKTINLPQ